MHVSSDFYERYERNFYFCEEYDSAIAYHQAANRVCSQRHEVGDFPVLTSMRTKESPEHFRGVYIDVLNPVLCKQKSFCKLKKILLGDGNSITHFNNTNLRHRFIPNVFGSFLSREIQDQK